MELQVIDNKGKQAGSVQFEDKLITHKASPALLHEVIVAYHAGQRAGTHETKTRSLVSGGGIKPWKQKGTGRARSGSTRSPLWRHGGIIHGPHQRDYAQSLPIKKKKLAFRMALKELIDAGKLQVVDSVEVKEPKTKAVAAVYANWQAPNNSLFVVEKIETLFNRAARNIAAVALKDVESLNTFDCLAARKVFITKGALEKLSARISKSLEN